MIRRSDDFLRAVAPERLKENPPADLVRYETQRSVDCLDVRRSGKVEGEVCDVGLTVGSCADRRRGEIARPIRPTANSMEAAARSRCLHRDGATLDRRGTRTSEPSLSRLRTGNWQPAKRYGLAKNSIANPAQRRLDR